jgi:aspartate ammonia-lyase
VYAEYRAVWFYADTAFNHVNAIEAELKNCETYMDRSISNSTGLNGNYMAFNHLTKSCSCLIKSCEIIIKIYMEKKIFVPCHRLKYLIEQANYTRVKLANYSVKQLQDVELESIEETSY